MHGDKTQLKKLLLRIISYEKKINWMWTIFTPESPIGHDLKRGVESVRNL
jgi:hypothetical protein